MQTQAEIKHSETKFDPKESESTSLDFSKITDFNHALIYGQGLESSVSASDPTDVDCVLHGAGQLQDVYNAYGYAQTEILPFIRQQGRQAITADLILKWILQIHLRIAHTLAVDNRAICGEYVDRFVVRWKEDAKLQHYLLTYIEDYNHTSEEPRNNIIKITAKMSKQPEAIARRMVELFVKMSNRDDIKVPEDKSINLVTSVKSLGIISFYRLIHAYHINILTPDEKELVNKFFKVCLPPEQMPIEMRKFAEELASRWQACDVNNIDEVVALVQYAYYQLTEIHPFFNGNGRSSTCLMNIILSSLGQPSILMRDPEDRDDPESSYAIAIKNINTDQSFLFKHLKERISQSSGFKDDLLKSNAIQQVEIAILIRKLKRVLPKSRLQQIYVEYTDKVSAYLDIKKSSTLSVEELRAKFLPLFIKQLTALHQQLMIFQPPAKAKAPAVTQYVYTAEDKASIVEKLTALTQEANWKTYKTNGLTVLLNCNSAEKAQEVVKILQNAEGFTVSLKVNPKTKENVVYLDNFNMKKFLAISTLTSTAPVAEVVLKN